MSTNVQALAVAKKTMSYSLKNLYGRFRIPTDAWNATQDKLRCCAVENEGWQEYQDSYWDRLTNADVRDRNRKLVTWNPFYRFVPQSCCRKLMDPLLKWIPSKDYHNVARCQHWQFGPPTHKIGAFNDAIYYRVSGLRTALLLTNYLQNTGGSKSSSTKWFKMDSTMFSSHPFGRQRGKEANFQFCCLSLYRGAFLSLAIMTLFSFVLFLVFLTFVIVPRTGW